MSAQLNIATRRFERSARDHPRAPPTPFKGLSYFDVLDAPFFFGREDETQVVAANLVASRLTVLYGESGVGKSSLLRAGTTRHLMDIARENVERRGRPRHVVAVFPGAGTSWREDPIRAVLGAVEQAVASLGLELEPADPELDLSAQLGVWTQNLRSDLLIILDQFEEYLLYHAGEEGAQTLAEQLPRAVATLNLRVNFLIAIREDMLARLDSFKGRIPTIFDNAVRVNHLGRRDARKAIELPIAHYNELRGDETPVTIEPALVETLLDELETGRVVVGVAGAALSAEEEPRGEDHPIETPYLQLVMMRLWREEMQAGSDRLRLATLDRLGHSDRIVKTHLDETMRTLPRYARAVAARAFHHLVTPSGSKIAHTPSDLAAYTGLDEVDIKPLLERLTEPKYRILRRVARSTAEDAPARYEIFHDVLGAPILDWRSRYLLARQAPETARNGITTTFDVIFGIVCVFFVIDTIVTRETATDALWIAWSVSALLIWLRTTIVLVQRWQRREAWAVPLIGSTMAATGPFGALVLAGNYATRAVRGRSDRARVPATRVDVQRFGALAAIVAGVVVVLACLVPAIYVDVYSDAGYGTTDERLIGSDGRLWFALEPLACAALAVLLGITGLIRPRPRHFGMGVLSGLGMTGLAYFFALFTWPDAFRRLTTTPHPDYLGVKGGVFLGFGGAGLVIVAAAPLVVVQLLAAIVGARRIANGQTRTAARMDLDRVRSRLQLSLGVLGFAGALTGVLAAFINTGPWRERASVSLWDVSLWTAWLVIVPCAAAAIAAIVIMLSDGVSLRAAGWVTGCGLGLVALFAGELGDRHWHGPTGVYLGIVGGAVLALSGALSKVAATVAPSMRASDDR